MKHTNTACRNSTDFPASTLLGCCRHAAERAANPQREVQEVSFQESKPGISGLEYPEKYHTLSYFCVSKNAIPIQWNDH